MIGFARARRLPVEGKAQDQHDEAGGSRERHRQRGIGAPGRQRLCAQLHDGELTGVEVAYGGECVGAVGQWDIENARRGAEGGQRLGRPQHVEEPAANHAEAERLRDHGRAAGLGGEHVAYAGNDHAVDIGDEDLSAGGARPGRDQRVELVLQSAVQVCAPHRTQAVEAFGDDVGTGFNLSDQLGDRLPPMVENLHEGADTDSEKEGDDQRRDRPSQRRLGGQ